MRTVFTTFLLLQMGWVAAPSQAVDWLAGRYQAMVMGQGSNVFILDTKEGHCWIYDLNDQSLRYCGAVRPGAKAGDVIAEPEEMTLEELKKEMEDLKKAIEEEERAKGDRERAAEARKEFQKAIEKANLKDEVKAELKKAVDAGEIREDTKAELRKIIDALK